jgi:hypothetical protein
VTNRAPHESGLRHSTALCSRTQSTAGEHEVEKYPRSLWRVGARPSSPQPPPTPATCTTAGPPHAERFRRLEVASSFGQMTVMLCASTFSM